MTDQTTLFYYSGPASGLVPALKAALAQANTMSGYEIEKLLGHDRGAEYSPTLPTKGPSIADSEVGLWSRIIAESDTEESGGVPF